MSYEFFGERRRDPLEVLKEKSKEMEKLKADFNNKAIEFGRYNIGLVSAESQTEKDELSASSQKAEKELDQIAKKINVLNQEMNILREKLN